MVRRALHLFQTRRSQGQVLELFLRSLLLDSQNQVRWLAGNRYNKHGALLQGPAPGSLRYLLKRGSKFTAFCAANRLGLALMLLLLRLGSACPQSVYVVTEQ